MKRHNKHATPLLVGELTGEKTIAVWCPFCKTHHFHGWGPEAKDNDVEHRGAHCDQGSPLKEEGYYIGLTPKENCGGSHG